MRTAGAKEFREGKNRKGRKIAFTKQEKKSGREENADSGGAGGGHSGKAEAAWHEESAG